MNMWRLRFHRHRVWWSKAPYRWAASIAARVENWASERADFTPDPLWRESLALAHVESRFGRVSADKWRRITSLLESDSGGSCKRNERNKGEGSG